MGRLEETGDTGDGAQSGAPCTQREARGEVGAHQFSEGVGREEEEAEEGEGEEETESSGLGEQQQPPPFPTRSYSCAGGDFLHLFHTSERSTERMIHCYSPWVIKGNDNCSLVAHVEVEDGEKGFTLGVCGAEEHVVGTFLHYFASGETMLPMLPQEVRRCCICPWHRRAVLLALLDDRIISCVQLPSAEFCLLRNAKARLGEQQEHVLASEKPEDAFTRTNAWRVVVEHKGRGFVRFYGVERREGFCFCDAPILYVT